MIDDVVPDDAWRTLDLTRERYLPWEDGWFQESGLLLLVNQGLYLHGMAMSEVFTSYDYDRSIGFDIEGTGAYPMPPEIWSNPDMIESVNQMRRLITPRVPPGT